MRALVKRYFLITAGVISLSLGVLGAFVPLLPTVPLVLLAAFCFARSSEKLHGWLLNHRVFGQILRNFETGKGVPRRVKYRAILILWLSMGISCWLVARTDLCILLSIIGLLVSVYIYRLPEYSNETMAADSPETTNKNHK